MRLGLADQLRVRRRTLGRPGEQHPTASSSGRQAIAYSGRYGRLDQPGERHVADHLAAGGMGEEHRRSAAARPDLDQVRAGRRRVPLAQGDGHRSTVAPWKIAAMGSAPPERALDLGHQPQHQQRVPAQGEEVVVSADGRTPSTSSQIRGDLQLRPGSRRGTRRGGSAGRPPAPAAPGGRSCRCGSAEARSSTTSGAGTMYSGSRSRAGAAQLLGRSAAAAPAPGTT